MTDTITLNDGVVSRSYEKLYGPDTRNASKGIVTHVRKTAEADATPETLTIRQEAIGVNQKSTLTIRLTKLNEVTQKPSTLTGFVGIEGDKVNWTQAEKEAMFTQLAAALAVAGLKTDMVVGRI